MSEYQYYEFQAVDSPLTTKEMAELRSYSTRARISATSFLNDDSWGSFKGDEDAWMEKYFEAFSGKPRSALRNAASSPPKKPSKERQGVRERRKSPEGNTLTS